MIDTNMIARLTPFISANLDIVGLNSIEHIFQGYMVRQDVLIVMGQMMHYPISCQALFSHPKIGKCVVLPPLNHPYLDDMQRFHALAHVVMGDPFHDDINRPPAHLLLTNEHERDVSVLAMMLFITWQSSFVPFRESLHRFGPYFTFLSRAPRWFSPTVTAAPRFDVHHLNALSTYLNARLQASLLRSPSSVMLMYNRDDWPALSTKSLAELQSMTNEAMTGTGDHWDEMMDESINLWNS